MDERKSFLTIVKAFLDACPHDKWSFPFGNEVSIPMETEEHLLLVPQSTWQSFKEDIRWLRSQLTLRDGYSCVMFSVRTAILAARLQRPEYLKNGLCGLVLDNGRIDYRDRLRALSIIEYCANLVDVDLADELHTWEGMLDDAAKNHFIGYFSRLPEWRSMEIMGFVVTGKGKNIEFSKR